MQALLTYFMPHLQNPFLSFFCIHSLWTLHQMFSNSSFGYFILLGTKRQRSRLRYCRDLWTSFDSEMSGTCQALNGEIWSKIWIQYSCKNWVALLLGWWLHESMGKDLKIIHAWRPCIARLICSKKRPTLELFIKALNANIIVWVLPILLTTRLFLKGSYFCFKDKASRKFNDINNNNK